MAQVWQAMISASVSVHYTNDTNIFDLDRCIPVR